MKIFYESKSVIVVANLIIVLCISIQGCQKTGQIRLPENTVDSVVRHYFQERGKAYGPSPLYDFYYFMNLHRDEILETLEIAEIAETEKVSIAFTRFSVGTDVFRKALYLRKVEDRWTISGTRGWFDSKDYDDPFGDGQPERAKELMDKADKWDEEGAKAWWSRRF